MVNDRLVQCFAPSLLCVLGVVLVKDGVADDGLIVQAHPRCEACDTTQDLCGEKADGDLAGAVRQTRV